jgi:Spy/CpxP family protein refolding chaperone
MWRKISPLLFILSVTLNLAFTGTWIVGTLQRKTMPGCGAQPGSGEIWCPLHRQLGISGAQWRKIEPRIRVFNDSTRVQCERMRSLRSELVDLLAAEPTDREAIAAKQAEILNGQREMQKQIIAHLLAEKQFLTPEQSTKLFQMMKEKSGCASGANAALCSFPVGKADSQIPIESQE